jgi:hypothetical protein
MALTQSFDVEFDDALLDLDGWKNPRYEGSKLVGRKINEYSPPSPPLIPVGTTRWSGDITYGKNPVIENKIVALYFGTTIIGGDSGEDEAEEAAYVKLAGHSYVTIDKILLINTDTDQVEIINRQNTTQDAFKRFVDRDFPEGSRVNLKLIDKSVDNALNQNHFVKFNRGSLQKLYKYTANEDGHEDGVFGGFGIRNNSGNVHTGSLEGGGLFGFGMTAAVSRSLFNTQSIQFVQSLPEELSQYDGDVTLATLGNELAPITSSFSIGGIDEFPQEPTYQK